MKQSITKAAHGAIRDSSALKSPQYVEIALHAIDPDTLAAAPALTMSHRLLTIVTETSRVVALAYVPAKDAGDLIEAILRILAPYNDVVLKFVQGAVVTSSCRAFLEQQDADFSEVAISTEWPEDSVRNPPEWRRKFHLLNGWADQYSVEAAQAAMACTRRTRSTRP